MARKIEFEINESEATLIGLRKETKSIRLKTRILFLLLIKENGRFKKLPELSEYLNVSISSLKRWKKTYLENGLDKMLTISNGGKRREAVTKAMHDALEIKLKDSTNPLSGYWDAVDWVESEFGAKIKYTTLRSYLIKHFQTKLKVPRKSHYKKNEQALVAFKKIPN